MATITKPIIKLDINSLSHEDQERVLCFCKIMATGLYRYLEKKSIKALEVTK
jgi:hypothetical protein